MPLTMYSIVGTQIFAKVISEALRLIYGPYSFTIPGFLTGVIKIGDFVFAKAYGYIIVVAIPSDHRASDVPEAHEARQGHALRCAEQDGRGHHGHRHRPQHQYYDRPELRHLRYHRRPDHPAVHHQPDHVQHDRPEGLGGRYRRRLRLHPPARSSAAFSSAWSSPWPFWSSPRSTRTSLPSCSSIVVLLIRPGGFMRHKV